MTKTKIISVINGKGEATKASAIITPEEEFSKVGGNTLTFSSPLALEKPMEHDGMVWIRTKGDILDPETGAYVSGERCVEKNNFWMKRIRNNEVLVIQQGEQNGN